MAKWLQQALTIAGTWLSRPWAVGAVLLYAVLWLAFEPRGFDWHGVATIATLFMTLFIQRSEHRDTQAIHAKLDELLRANGDARNELTNLDKRQPEQIEAFRDKAREEGMSRPMLN
jgi:low affinity Fe/Cu permease